MADTADPGSPAPARAGLPAGVLKSRFTELLSGQLRPFLKDRGFAKSGPTFSRRRGRLYDVINFQGSSRNGLGATEHRFYVNVGIGSLDVEGSAQDDAVPPARPQLTTCLVWRRWADLAPGAPHELTIRPNTDPAGFADEVRARLATLITFLDSVDSTEVLVDFAIERNGLLGMDETCAYLARTDDIERLERYVGTLRRRFGTDVRWPMLNDRIIEKVGPHAALLHSRGLLDELS